MQVRETRKGGDAQKGIKDNMVLAFTNVIDRLDAVYAARSSRIEGLIAVKMVEVSASAHSREQLLQDIEREVAILRTCRHANALALLGFCLDAAAPCLVSPLCRGGNLDDRLFDTPAGRQRLEMLGFTHGLSPLLIDETFERIQEINAQGIGVLMVEQNVRFGLRMASSGIVKRSEPS